MLTIWKAAIFEGIGSMVIVWFAGVSTATILSYETPIIGPYVAISTAFIVSLSVYALLGRAHVSLITVSTLLTGNLEPIRAAAYLFAQMTGACIGGAFVAIALGPRAIPMGNAGCNLVEAKFSIGQAVSIEFMSSFTLLIIAYGTGLAQSARDTLGIKLAPILTGLTVGSIVFAVSSIAPGGIFIGSSGFPTRCFGLAVGIGKLPPFEWIFFIPMLAAAVVHAALYRLVLPYGPLPVRGEAPAGLPTAGPRAGPPAGLEGVTVVSADDLLRALRSEAMNQRTQMTDEKSTKAYSYF